MSNQDIFEQCGYTIEKVEEDPTKKLKLAYLAHGKRGATYYFYRTITFPHVLFVCNSKGKVCTLISAKNFTDKNGVLEPVYTR